MATNNDMTQEQIEEICKILGIETLEERHSDSLDFHEVSVWQISAALRQAYANGRAYEIVNQKF